MNNRGLVLVLDCDGLIMDSVKLIEDAVAKVDYRCSKKYIECIQACAREKEQEIFDRYFWVDHETYNRLIKQVRMSVDRYIDISRITFDEVVEEVFPMYAGKVDYNFIYQIEHAYKGVIEKIRELYHSGMFSKIYICTHCNSQNEINAKENFFKKYLPMAQSVYVPFHTMPYIYDSERYFENRKRVRTNKPGYFFAITDESPENTIFIDDSREICAEAEEIGAIPFHRDRKNPDPLHPFTEMEKYIMEHGLIESGSKTLTKKMS